MAIAVTFYHTLSKPYARFQRQCPLHKRWGTHILDNGRTNYPLLLLLDVANRALQLRLVTCSICVNYLAPYKTVTIEYVGTVIKNKGNLCPNKDLSILTVQVINTYIENVTLYDNKSVRSI